VIDLRVPELLAPAGSPEALRAAVENGADAVYLGGGSFNARRSAANFGSEDLARAVLYAHRRGVRVYVTVNILVHQDELPALAAFLQTVHAAGADAVIVQDPAVVLLVRELFPDLPWHASTQMTVHATAAARFWREAGCERIVLARELRLPEIGRIRREAGVQVEVFAHGALCIGYSGQCLFSSLIGGRSGNRGLCAQPCRLPYQLVGPDREPVPVPGPFLLSTRDLNLSGALPDLAAAGVDALKIEGRLRRPAYVATVVRIYRRLLDRLGRGDNGVPPDAARELAQVFNRDFTTGYLYGNPGPDLMSHQRPNNRGLAAGRVVGYERGRARIHLTLPVARGDALAVWVSRGGRVAVTVGEMLLAGRPVERAPAGSEVELAVPAPVRPGDRVFKTLDAGLAAASRVTAGEAEIPLAMTVELAAGKPVRLAVTGPGGHFGTARSRAVAQTAAEHPLTFEVLRRQLGRLGHTGYRLAELTVQGPPGLWLPLSDLNTLRRAALADLERRAWGRRLPVAYEAGLARLLSGDARREEKGPPALAVAVSGLPACAAACAAGAEVVYLSGEPVDAPVDQGDLATALELCRRRGVRLVPATPVIAHDDEYPRLEALLDACRELGLETVLAGNAGPLALARGHGLAVWADHTLPAFNSLALRFWREHGVAGVTLSPELTLAQVRELGRLSPLPLEALVHGALRLMVSAHCPPGAAAGARGRKNCPRPCREGRWFLRDRKGELFGLVADGECRMHLFNGRDLSMYAHLTELLSVPLRLWRIEARGRDARYVGAVTAVYRGALDRLAAGGEPVRAGDRATLERLSPAGLTGAHYFRGVR